MFKRILTAVALCFLANGALLADEVTCESQDDRRVECAMDTRGAVRVARQLSKTQCVEGENWGISKHAVWVDAGCRAVFVSEGGGGSQGYAGSENLPKRVTCESQNDRRVECAMDTRGGVHVVRQLSKTRCIEGQNWGLSKHAVWVEGGCRAEFELQGGGSSQSHSSEEILPKRVTCESRDNRRVECAMDTRGAVRVARQLSDTKCLEGQNWGLSKHAVWVEGGCRAEFELEAGGSPHGEARESAPTSEQIAACNAVEDRYGRVVSHTPLKPGAWEIILIYDDGEYVCNVDAHNRVSYFEKSRR